MQKESAHRMPCAVNSYIPGATWVNVGYIIPRVSQPGSQRCSADTSVANFKVDENKISTPRGEPGMKQRTGFHGNIAHGALSVPEGQDLLFWLPLWNHHNIPTAEWRLLFLGFHGATLLIFRKLICGLYIKTVHPTFGHLLVTIIMNICYHLQTGGWK